MSELPPETIDRMVEEAIQLERGSYNECVRDVCCHVKALACEIERLQSKLQQARESLKQIVCTVQPDAGVVLLSEDGPTHLEEWNGKTVSVYDHQYFSPLGDALIGLYQKLGGEVK